MPQGPFDLRTPSGIADLDAPTHPWHPAPAGVPAQRVQSQSPRMNGLAHLVISRGPDTGKAIPVTTGQMAIGRHRDCDIVLEDATVSRRHANLHRHGDRYVIADSGSLNGTYINRRPVDRAVLSDGDEVWIGKVRFIFQMPR